MELHRTYTLNIVIKEKVNLKERKWSVLYTEKSKRERVGYSKKITDPAFEKYLKQSKKWSLMFSLILAVIAVTGFFIYGETSVEMDNPQAIYIGIVVGGMFILIGILKNLSRKKDKTWDGSVIDKKIQRKTKKDGIKDYILYTIYVQSYSGKIHKITAEDDDTLYNYYLIGDKVRHHGGLNTFEKLDKSKDTIIFCNACAYLNDIEYDYCYKCKCPLLK